MKRFLFLMNVVLFSVFWFNPAFAQKTIYDAKYPAKFPEASKYTKVSVLPFRGHDGEIFASALSGKLQSALFDGSNYFELKSLDGLNYTPPKGGAAAASTETAKAITIGNKLGVQAVIVGEIISDALSHNIYTEQRTRCVQSGKKLFSACEQSENYAVQCRKTTMNFSVVPRMIVLSNSRVVYSETVSFQDYYDQCNGELKAKPEDVTLESLGCSLISIFGGCKSNQDPDAARKKIPVSTDEALKQAIHEQAAEYIRNSVAPFNYKTQVEFMSKASDLPKDQQKLFATASAYAKANRLDRACSDWEAMGKGLETGSINLLYNLGVCQEALVPEDPASAREYFSKADRMNTNPTSEVGKLLNKALERTLKMVDRQKGIKNLKKL